jgi:phosphoribosylformimino-5-aminoimidazole carboxamide ribotide isomerase
MMVVPAVDLKDGKCVRLTQGRMDQETVYSQDPVQMAKHWESKGAERLHVVDLNGAVTGKPVHRSLIEDMVSSVSIPVEVGGGIRDLQTIERYLAAGVRWAILGSVAFQNPRLIHEACLSFPDNIILAVDAKRGKVAIQGWKELVPLDAQELIRRFEGIRLSAIIVTDIEKDGMGTGLNWEWTRALAQVTSIPVIASGGVSRLEDIQQVMQLELPRVIGVIVGRALYTGWIDLEAAIRLGKGMEA